MDKAKAIQIIKSDFKMGCGCCMHPSEVGWCDNKCQSKKAINMAIEALQIDLVRCKDCKHSEHCHETIAHTKEHDGFREHWSEPIEWCSRGERKGDGDTTKESEEIECVYQKF